MNIYIIRHGDAERIAPGKKDYERELTLHGKNEIEKSAIKWKNFIDGFDYIVSSPMLRAEQTAKIVAEVFDYNKEIILENSLLNGGNTNTIADFVNSLDAHNVALIGHQPDCGYHLSNLISGSDVFIEFKKGTIAKVSFNGKMRISRGVLEFLLPPGVFK